MEKIIGIAVHVDTYEGAKKGVPTLLALFQRYGIRASFFVPMGKDHTGWAIKRIFTRKGFLKKSGTGRVWAAATSLKTLMYGLLLPGPEIARKNMEILRRIVGEGHELGIHGYDHVYWHDHIKHFDRVRTEKEIDKLLQTYRELMGGEALSFAAPGWMVNPHVFRNFQEKGLLYSSDTRKGRGPFYPEMAGERFHILQIPTTLPTLDEVVGAAGKSDKSGLVDYYLKALIGDGFNILTVHAEIEGRGWSDFFEGFLKKTIENGYAYRRLVDIAEDCKEDSAIPTCSVEYGFVEGRAGEVCLQGAMTEKG